MRPYQEVPPITVVTDVATTVALNLAQGLARKSYTLHNLGLNNLTYYVLGNPRGITVSDINPDTGVVFSAAQVDDEDTQLATGVLMAGRSINLDLSVVCFTYFKLTAVCAAGLFTTVRAWFMTD